MNDGSPTAWDNSSWLDPAIPITDKLKVAMILTALPLVLAASIMLCPVLILLGRFSRANVSVEARQQ